MDDDDESSDWETSVYSQGVEIPTPEINTIIHIEENKLLSMEDQKDEDLVRSPPTVTPSMFPESIKSIVDACCAHSEAVPVSVAINILTRFSALIGPTVYLQIGDEKRFLNNFVLMVGPTGLGKGASNHGPSRLFRRVEENLALDLDRRFQSGCSEGIKTYQNLKIHTGGLSSGEGLAAALDDGEDGSDHAITDKRILIFEPEFAQLMNMAQRSGNILSVVLRNAFDGNDIKPMTKRDKVSVTNPYLCLVGNITADELGSHEQTATMATNGMLNRFLILWQQPEKLVAFPKPIPDNVIDSVADAIADLVMFARDGQHETHYKKMAGIARPIRMSDDAALLWSSKYGQLINRVDCKRVKLLTRRHRLHALQLSALFAMLDRRMIIEPEDIISALAWCEYSRWSVVYSFRSLGDQTKAERYQILANTLVRAIRETLNKKNQCTSSDLYKWFSRKIRQDQLSKALEILINHIPPIVTQEVRKEGRGRPTKLYWLTDHQTQG